MQRWCYLWVFAALWGAQADASISEIRQDFYQQKANLAAQAIMAAPSWDASYMIAVYESSSSLETVPTLRWTDENGAAQSAVVGRCAGVGWACRQLIRPIRVKAGTVPTVETKGYDGVVYSLYVFGLGFWTIGGQGQAGLTEVRGIADAEQLAYSATGSVSALFVAYSNLKEGSQHFTYWDENGEHSVGILYGSPLVLPIRISAGTTVWVYNSSPRSTNLWYGLVVFGTPADGAGPFGDFEYNLLDWTNATYPKIDSAAQGLFSANIARPANPGTIDEVLYASVNGISSSCSLTAAPSGAPADCVGMTSAPFQYWTINSPGTMWGISPMYSAEIDVLTF